jgi:hypothetical protein
MRVRSWLQRAFGLPAILAATLLFAPLDVPNAGAEPLKFPMDAKSSSGFTLAQASVERVQAKRKHYKAAAKRTRAMLESERTAPSATPASPRIPGGTKNDVNDAVCIAGC